MGLIKLEILRTHLWTLSCEAAGGGRAEGGCGGDGDDDGDDGGTDVNDGRGCRGGGEDGDGDAEAAVADGKNPYPVRTDLREKNQEKR